MEKVTIATEVKFTYASKNGNVDIVFCGEGYGDCVDQAEAHRKTLKRDTGVRHTIASYEVLQTKDVECCDPFAGHANIVAGML